MLSLPFHSIKLLQEYIYNEESYSCLDVLDPEDPVAISPLPTVTELITARYKVGKITINHLIPYYHKKIVTDNAVKVGKNVVVPYDRRVTYARIDGSKVYGAAKLKVPWPNKTLVSF